MNAAVHMGRPIPGGFAIPDRPRVPCPRRRVGIDANRWVAVGQSISGVPRRRVE